MHCGLRGFAHLIEEMRCHLPKQGKGEGSERSHLPPASEVCRGQTLKNKPITAESLSIGPVFER
jgi:hypothetical protein